MHRIFCDMDGPLVDFDGYCRDHQLTPDEVKVMRGAYYSMLPTPGAIEALREIMAMGWDVWIASKPVTARSHVYAEKVDWILDTLPELERKIILTHDKGLLGDAGDWLIDDRPEKANCRDFRGHFIHFRHPAQWIEIVHTFRRQMECRAHLAGVPA